MGRKRHWCIGAVVVVAFALAGAGAQAAGPPDEPDLQAMALAVADFDGGGVVFQQGFVTAPAPVVAEYARYFRPGARLAGRRLLYVGNVDFSLDEASTTQLAFSAFVQELGTPAGRKQIIDDLVSNLRKGNGGRLKIKSTSAGRPVTLQLGQGAFRVAIVLKTNIGRLEFAVTGVRVDRAIGLIALAAYPRARLTSGPAVLATARLAKRFAAGFVLSNTVLPTIVGTPQQGQALTADPGHWAGGPGGLAYQWNRCAAAGTPCTAIPGATAQTYVPTAADSASRLSVTVTASNTISQSSASSTPTNPVP
jgi:hypothetical protein